MNVYIVLSELKPKILGSYKTMQIKNNLHGCYSDERMVNETAQRRSHTWPWDSWLVSFMP